MFVLKVTMPGSWLIWFDINSVILSTQLDLNCNSYLVVLPLADTVAASKNLMQKHESFYVET